MRAVFADAFYFFSLLSASDQAHGLAVDFSRRQKVLVVTTAWVLTEFADGFARTARRAAVAPLIERISHHPRWDVLPPGEEFYVRGLTLYENRPDKRWSLTDCISFVVMVDHGLTEALAGDRHFERAGFAALL